MVEECRGVNIIYKIDDFILNSYTMKIELLFIAVIVFFVMDTMQDGKYTKQLKSYKKHIKIIGFLFAAFSMYLFIKKNPSESRSMLGHLNGMIHYMPIDKQSKDMITPFLNTHVVPPQEQRIMTSGNESTSRSVSGTKKKYVAASQNWKCNGCKGTLDAWYEIDHKIRLADGGSNHITNLVALCRNCHGKKTMIENF
jgi:hypothetical protein